MTAVLLSLEQVHRRKGGSRYAFDRSPEFPAPWWYMGYSGEPNARCYSARRDGIEVVRCKLRVLQPADAMRGFDDMPKGQVDILALEVAVSARRQGVGRAFLLAVGAEYPGTRLTALNDDATSRKFWDGVGWIREKPSNPMFAGVERVTYSEA
jgi:GNAT superfamily N-acetyltransferase